MRSETAAGEGRVRRFHPARLAEHWVHVAVFAALAATGLAQKYHSLDASQWLILELGGIDRVRLVHRLAALAATLAVVAHVAAAAAGILLRRWQPSMAISRKDFADLARDLRYTLGAAESPARAGRYTYKQKFEYWAILTGVLLMMASGFVLWFPVATARVLPAELIPAAKVLHTNEALFIVLVVAIWHVYGALFSPEVFPLDTSIFTGTITRDRMAREHPLELSELEGAPPAEPTAAPAAGPEPSRG